MWVVLGAAAAGSIVRECVHPFYDGAADAFAHWVRLLPFGLLLAYVVVGRWKKGPTTLWAPTWPEWRRILVAAPVGLIAVRLLFEDEAGWRWLFGGVAALMVPLAALRGVFVLRDRRARTDQYGVQAADPYA